MAKLFPPPPEYRPALGLWLRADEEGGPLLDRLRSAPLNGGDARREIVVLVHGFNNHYGEAGSAYHGFRNRQLGADPALRAESLEALFGDLYWPGDAAWGKFDRADFFVYPAAVATAQEAAPLLATYLTSLPNLLTVHFVGHSLGCRVILETTAILAQRSAPRVGKVCLMAAAVPASKIVIGAPLADAMRAAEATLVLYSEADVVLRFTFPPGQTAARGREGFLPTALGRFGPRPDTAGTLQKAEIAGANHGDYWGHAANEIAGIAPRKVADFLEIGTRTRALDDRTVAHVSAPGFVRGVGEDARSVGRARTL